MSRITFVDHIYFENPGEVAIELSAAPHEYETTVDEEPYTRRYKLDVTPINLDLNWLEDNAGMVIIKNLSKTATVYLCGKLIIVPPGQCIRCWLNWEQEIPIFATEPDTKAYVTICPK